MTLWDLFDFVGREHVERKSNSGHSKLQALETTRRAMQAGRRRECKKKRDTDIEESPLDVGTGLERRGTVQSVLCQSS